ASCLSQLAHCFRLLSAWPKPMLNTLDIEEDKKHEFKDQASSLFELANDLEPYRKALKKDESWRKRERQLLVHIAAFPQ
ncbi:hypothetical protein, partial [Sansalvadorimonas verongulae]|uniref:hypothetical protein n=1 Tax=Sansalvadorimonas verongulae TaxID=2172824 RepID=UPI001E2B7237